MNFNDEQMNYNPDTEYNNDFKEQDKEEKIEEQTASDASDREYEDDSSDGPDISANENNENGKENADSSESKGEPETDEVKMILKMLQEQKISIEEAQEMLKILGYENIDPDFQNNKTTSNIGNPKLKKGRITISVNEKGKNKVRVNVPSKFMKYVNSFIPDDIEFNNREIHGMKYLSKEFLEDTLGKSNSISINVDDNHVKIIDGDGNVIVDVDDNEI